MLRRSIVGIHRRAPVGRRARLLRFLLAATKILQELLGEVRQLTLSLSEIQRRVAPRVASHARFVQGACLSIQLLLKAAQQLEFRARRNDRRLLLVATAAATLVAALVA